MALWTSRLISAALCAALLVVACATDDETKPFDPASIDAGLAPGCEEKLADFVNWYHAEKACTADSDCAFVSGSAPIYEWCGAGYYVNASSSILSKPDAGTSPLQEREAELDGCFPFAGSGCAGIPPAPRCWQGECFPSDEGFTTASQCFQASDKSDCMVCLCGTQFGDDLTPCLQDAACKALFTCAKKHGYFGRYAPVVLSSPDSPCAAQYAAAPKGMRDKWHETYRVGCFARCKQ